MLAEADLGAPPGAAAPSAPRRGRATPEELRARSAFKV
jgi:hypothetical protein